MMSLMIVSSAKPMTTSRCFTFSNKFSPRIRIVMDASAAMGHGLRCHENTTTKPQNHNMVCHSRASSTPEKSSKHSQPTKTKFVQCTNSSKQSLETVYVLTPDSTAENLSTPSTNWE